MSKNKIVIVLLFALASLLIVSLFSYKILDVPMGLTVDETAFGYNAALLAHHGRDENGRFMPFFVLSINGQDWRQPVTQYYLALLFKIFGPSLFLLRFSSVIITVISGFLIFKLAKLFFKPLPALAPVLLFFTTPLVMIQSHLGLDNIMPVPLTILWLYGLIRFSKKDKKTYLISSALFLSLSFYSYKGMRAVFPVWLFLSLAYLFLLKTNRLKNIIFFSLVCLPFMAIVPLLNRAYPGAILGGANPKVDSIYNLVYPYLSSFDPTFLFIRGDSTPFHSTGKHGMMLLSSLPFFIIGLFAPFEKRQKLFIILSFFSAPLLYGLVDSAHRASRLMCLIPPYVLIATIGFSHLFKNKFGKITTLILVILISVNYLDFIKFYWQDYRLYSQSFLGDLKPYLSFEQLKKKSQSLNLTPYVADDIQSDFFQSIYFPNGISVIDRDLVPPPNSILLTNRLQIDGMNRLDHQMSYYYLQVKQND